MPGKTRCRVHGGASTGARSLDGKQRQAEGRERYLARQRGQQGGPAKATIPSRAPATREEIAALTATALNLSVTDPVERMRLDALTSLPPSPALPNAQADAFQPQPATEPPTSPPPAPEPGMRRGDGWLIEERKGERIEAKWPQTVRNADDELIAMPPEVHGMVTIFDLEGNPIQVPAMTPEEIRTLVERLFADGILPLPQPKPEPSKPTLAVVNPEPMTGPRSAVPLPAIVKDVNKIAAKNEEILLASMESILGIFEHLRQHPLDYKDPNLAALLTFVSLQLWY